MFNNQELEFPVQCTCKVICLKDGAILEEVEKRMRILGQSGIPIISKTSSKGKYMTIDAPCYFTSKENMVTVMTEFSSIPGVKTVL